MTREIKIVSPEHVEITFELAGLGSRFLAALIDTLLQGLAIILVVLALFGLSYVGFNLNIYGLSSWVISIVLLLLFVIWAHYFLFFELTRNGQTPGKKMIGIRVIRDTGHPVDFRAALLRNVVRLVDYLPSMYGIGIVSIFFSPQYRRLGDYVAGTLVVKTGKQHQTAMKSSRNHDTSQMPQSGSPDVPPESLVQHLTAMYTPQSEESQPLTLPPEALPHLSSVTRDDYRAVRHFLDRRGELEAGVAQSLAAKLVPPLAEKLHVDLLQIEKPMIFLESLAQEWERRMIR